MCSKIKDLNGLAVSNIGASLEWYNLESKGMYSDVIGSADGHIPKQDMETLWAQVVFTF